MEVKNNEGKTLYHAQSEGTYSLAHDMFIWSHKEPTKDQLKKAFLFDCNDKTEEGKLASMELAEAFLADVDVYKVYAEDIDNI